MSTRTLKDHLVEHYGGMDLPPQVVRRLGALADAEGEADVSHKLALRSRWTPVGVAVCIVLLATSVGLQVYQIARRPAALLVQRPAEPVSGWRAEPVDSGGAPRLVAVKFHIDGCPYAAETAPLFAALIDKYAEKPVVFAKYDMTTPARMAQSKNLARALGVEWLYEGAYQSGMIELVDRESGQVLAKVTKRNELETIEQALDQALP
jgi:thiol-disulfide isomerase/thioredoxin